MNGSSNSTRRSAVVALGAALVLVGAGIASARIIGGPPWSLEPVDAEQLATELTVEETDEMVQGVTDLVADLDEGCTTAVMGENDFATGDFTDAEQLSVLLAYDALVQGLDSGQTSHMVQSTRVLLDKCDESNEGLQNALAVHIRNWLKHYEHEMWLREKFADKWPDGKPGGNPHVVSETEDSTVHGKPDKAEKVHGNPHTETEVSGS